FDPALDARVTALESAQGRVNHAAAAAVAASLVAEAAARGAPFTRELAALERLDPGARLTGELREAALTGAPSGAAIGAGVPAAAAGAAAVVRSEGGRPGALSRAFGAVGRVFTLRRIDDLSGTSPDAVLARAERRALQGDLEGALVEIDSLSAAGQAALADWRAEAQRPLQLARRLARLFLLIAGALAALAVAAGGDAGRVQADWLGWRLDASAAAVLLLIGVLTLLAVVFWRVTLWLAEAPRRAERAREEARRREADAVLARGFLALAAGDGDQARRQAARAADLYAEPPPPTVALLKAQAAEAAHDPSAEPAW